MEAVDDFIETELQTPAHGRRAELQPFDQKRSQIFDLRALIDADHIEVNAVVLLEIGRREQVQHNGVNIDAVRFGHNNDARRIFVIRFVAQIDDHRQLFLLHLRGDLLEHLGARNLKRQRRHNNLVAFG
jgi:hypothetical protein